MKEEIQMEDNIINNMLQNPLRCAAIYARESNKSAQNALDTQVKSCLEFADKNNLVVYDIYKESISASKKSYDKRIEFMKLIEDAKRGYFKTIIVTKRDRIARNFSEYTEIKKIFKKLNIKVLYSNDIQLANNDDYALGFIDNLIMGIAEMEAATIAERTENGRRMLNESRIHKGPLPIGLCYKNGDGVKDGVMGDVINKVFDIFLSKDSVKTADQVIKELKKAAESFGDKKDVFNETVNILKPRDIERIIRTPKYAGLLIKSIDYKYKNFHVMYKDEVYDVGPRFFKDYINIPNPIITPKEWYDAVEKWTRNKKKRKSGIKGSKRTVYIFKDFFYCKRCGQNIKLKGNMFTCGTDKCLKMEKSQFIKYILDKTLKELVNNGEVDKAIKNVALKLRLEKDKSQRKLLLLSNEQKELVQKYVGGLAVGDIEYEIEEKAKEEVRIKRNVKTIEDKIQFLTNDFKRVAVLLVETDYINLLINEIEKNQLVLLEFLKYENMEKKVLNEYSIGIRGRKSRH